MLLRTAPDPSPGEEGEPEAGVTKIQRTLNAVNVALGQVANVAPSSRTQLSMKALNIALN